MRFHWLFLLVAASLPLVAPRFAELLRPIFIMAILGLSTRVVWPKQVAYTAWAPMVALYFLGIYLCRIAANARPADFDVPESESDELVEV